MAQSEELFVISKQDVLACSFENWYERFQQHTPHSIILPLSEEFVAYLNADGIELPKGAVPSANPNQRDTDSDSSGWGEDGDADSTPEFPDLVHDIKTAMHELGGAVLPKLNWSAPKDASWMTGTLCCTSADDILMLLKGSDFIAHDLNHCFDDCADASDASRADTYSLVLRRWISIEESSEFRCFVADGKLLAVSQRMTSAFFPHLSEMQAREDLASHLGSWFEQHVKDKFPAKRYVLDVSSNCAPRGKVLLIDFGPWGPTTDPLLYSWDDLNDMASAVEKPLAADVRVVLSEAEQRASRLENYHMVPLEVATMGMTTADEMEGVMRRAEQSLARSEAN
mmetsp:Transcript_41785/g.93958  ORF Transcript_41785/g.93958 Transcript_41785/m.93958 type:complete len:340 (+) Transcript_41785:51-1070(+)